MSDRRRTLHEIAPADWDKRPLSLAHEIARLLEPVKDQGTEIDSGSTGLVAAVWVTVGGVEYFITVETSQTQKIREGERYRCPTCDGGGEIAPNLECQDCNGVGTCLPPSATP